MSNAKTDPMPMTMSNDEKTVNHAEDWSQERSVEGGTLEEVLGYKLELRRNRSLFTLLFQSLAIAAVPYGFGAPLMSSVYGGGQLSMFVGWIIANLLTEATAISLGELASRYPTSGGPSYWSFQVGGQDSKATLAAFITGWVFLIGNITITLRYVEWSGCNNMIVIDHAASVNFGIASLLSVSRSNIWAWNFANDASEDTLKYFSLSAPSVENIAD